MTIKNIEYQPVAMVIDQWSEVDEVSRHRSFMPLVCGGVDIQERQARSAEAERVVPSLAERGVCW